MWRGRVHFRMIRLRDVLLHLAPEAAQEARHAFHAGLVPLQRQPRRGGEHGEQAHGVRAVAVDHRLRSEEHTPELQSLMRTSYAVFCLKKKNKSSARLNREIARTNNR